MRFPESWLRSYCDPQWSTQQLADALTMAGLEVEEAAPFAAPFDQVVVARVKSIARHPNADKLVVCEVDIGDGRSRTIVCGAPNVAPGLKVPCALPGAVLPGGLVIRAAEVRGVASDGMLCSARELALSEDHSGLMVLDDALAVGADLRVALSLDDTVFTLKLTPNRPDCLGVVGVAREVAAVSGAPMKLPSLPVAPVTIADRLAVRVLAPDLCGRFSGRVIRGVDARAATPGWMKSRLERAGQRSISALVDISNYVMLELGRPTHVFDLDRIHGGLQVRWGRAGEALKLLNGQTVPLDEQVGVIADEREVESLAGIMGGDATAVGLDTANVYVEAAFWWPAAIAGRARRYNFSTDAAHRFERGVDATTTVDHLEYLSSLILQICGGAAGPMDDTVLGLPPRQPVTMRVARARKVIGVDLSQADIADAFRRLGLQFEQQGDRFVVTPPAFRFDLEIEEDLIEEVVRIWGFDRLPVRPPRARAPMMAAPEGHRGPLAVKRQVAARDYQEVINYSFVASALDHRLSGKPAIRLLNPIAAQMDVMRTTLFGSLLENLRQNLNRKASRVRLFEVGRTYHADTDAASGPVAVQGVSQPLRLGLLAYGPAIAEQWGASTRQVDFYDLKGDLEAMLRLGALSYERDQLPALHPGRCARVAAGGRTIGYLGELHPAIVQELELGSAPILAELVLDALTTASVPVAGPVSRFPPVIRDLAVVLSDHVTAGATLAEIRSALASEPAGGLVKNVELFDEYRGKGLENKEKSLAFRFWMQDTERTLSDAEVAELLTRVVERLQRELGARLRS